MTNRLDTIAARQRQTRMRDRVFVAVIAVVTSLTISSVALGATMQSAPTAQTDVAR